MENLAHISEPQVTTNEQKDQYTDEKIEFIDFFAHFA